MLSTPGTTAHADTLSHRQFAHGYLLDANVFEGVALACVVLAECDPPVDEGLAYTDRLHSAAVPIALKLYRRVTDDFIKLGRILPESEAAQAATGAALRAAFDNPTPQHMKRTDFRFFERLRVRWAEIDAQKIVFNGHYLMYFDTAMGGYWRALAMPYAATMERLAGDLYVRKATVEYAASARYDDVLDIGLRCARIGNSSIVFSGAVFRQDQLLVSCELVYVFADPHAQTSKPVPEALREILNAFEAGETMVEMRLGTWATLGLHAGAIRTEVFIDEQKIPAEMEWDEGDGAAVHAVAFNRFGLPLATGRLLRHAAGVARIGRMATIQTARGSGVGRLVLDTLMQAAKARGDRKVLLHAQTSAQGFYARAGFAPAGSVFDEAGIAHIEMTRAL